ncbi:MAG: metalloregulator ArsR/SmtB family transcription factor [Cellvibrionaceae bacterium]|nr:metalloregulator ArsR/SmtB family transcription factor [Cellvibrionaceae bacterium]
MLNFALDSYLEPMAQLLKAAGDDLRLAILQVLARDSYGVLELAQALDVKQSGMSHHLKILANAGLVVTRREGNTIFYRRATLAPNDSMAPLKRELFRQIDAVETLFQEGLKQVWHERAQASQRFFLENADKFKAQQDLIASFEVYQPQITELLDLSPLPGRQAALEVGPGAGEFLPTLSARFTRVLALDNSPQMLAQARQLVGEQQLRNIQLLEGDTAHLRGLPGEFDCAVLNMVLHHTPSPAVLFSDISQSLKDNGVLLVTELCLHDQDWTQDACGDVWLGFAPEDLQEWAAAGGLQEGQSVYFALRNGFQIQLRQFIKSHNVLSSRS